MRILICDDASAALSELQKAVSAFFENREEHPELEPFIFVFANVFPEIPVLAVFLVLAGDIPFFHEGMETTLIRTTRRKWLLGQVTVVFLLTVFWLLFFLLCSLCIFGRDLLSLDHQWSSLGKLLARTGDGTKVGFGLSAQPSMDLVQGRKPLEALSLTVLLNGMQYTCIGMWCLALNLWTRRSYGSLLLVVFWILRRFGAGFGTVGKALNDLNPIGLTKLGSWNVQPQAAWRLAGIYVLETVLLWLFSSIRIRRLDMTKLG